MIDALEIMKALPPLTKRVIEAAGRDDHARVNG